MTNEYYPSEPQDYLRFELNLRQSRRPQYSLRAFARDLNISPSSLCEFLSGRQGLSRERVTMISAKIQLSLDQEQHLWDLIESRFARDRRERRAAEVRAERRAQVSQKRLPLERFRLVADWYHFALLEILSLESVRLTDPELAKAVGLSTEELGAALSRLERLGLITVDENGRRCTNTEVTVAGGEGADQAIRLCHQQTLRLHADAVEERSMDERESMSVSFKLPQAAWPELRKAMRDAVISVASRYGDSENDCDQVVSLAMQMLTLLPSEKLKTTSNELRIL
ncbi:MAG: TIGR02147 family protein [Bdellovibrionales bacterium]